MNLRLAIVHFLLGISSGIPLLLVGSTLQAWMKDSGVSLEKIGVLSLVGLPWSWKFLWSPTMDRYPLPVLTRRRGWMILTQIALMAAIGCFGFLSPADHYEWVGLAAVVIAFLSASQDIVIDAYRRESLSDAALGLGTSLAITGYRVGMLIAGAFALFLADHLPWSSVYLISGGFMGIGMLATLIAPESKQAGSDAPRSFRDAVIEPFKEYFKRPGAWWVLSFMVLYKLGDNMASSMTTPFVLDQGYTKTEYAGLVKGVGVLATIAGGIVGGGLLIRIGILRGLWLFGFFQAVSILVFARLSTVEKSLTELGFAVGVENLAFGMGTAAFTSFMGSLTNRKFTATQFALLSSLVALPRTLLSTPTGFIAQQTGWTHYFILCAVFAVPGLLVLARLQRLRIFSKQES